MKLPASQTHVFQSADMFIISNLKKFVKREHNDWVAQLYAQEDVSEATALQNLYISYSSTKPSHRVASCSLPLDEGSP